MCGIHCAIGIHITAHLKEKGRKVPELCYFTRVLLVWGALYGAKKACGATFVPFYSAKKENVSENRSKVVRPQRETWILIEKGNAVARPPCQYFRVWHDTGFH